MKYEVTYTAYDYDINNIDTFVTVCTGSEELAELLAYIAEDPDGSLVSITTL